MCCVVLYDVDDDDDDYGSDGSECSVSYDDHENELEII